MDCYSEAYFYTNKKTTVRCTDGLLTFSLYCLFFKSLKINEKGAGVRPFLHKNGLNLIKNG